MNDGSTAAGVCLVDRLDALEARIGRIEVLLAEISRKLEGHSRPAPAATAPDEAVVNLVARQLERLVPETCEHAEAPAGRERVLEGTQLRCTEDVAHRIRRIPIPFVRDLVVKKLVEYAAHHQVDLIDMQHFEKGATF